MKFIFDPRIITDIIGKGNYTEFRSILAEYVANAWDAEANNVYITIPEDFQNGSIIIQDDGLGIRETNNFVRIGYNVQTDGTHTKTFRRNIIGRKGIGRFAGFACVQEIQYISTVENEQVEFIFNRAEFLRHENVQEIEIKETVKNSNGANRGTIVNLKYLDGSYSLPSIHQIERDILLDFGIAEDFRIYLNGKLCELEELEGSVYEIFNQSVDFGEVKGKIILSKSRSKKLPPGIVIRVKNRRVEGPTLFGLEDGYSSKITNRIYGDITANSLDDIISSGREAFIQHEEKYKKLIVFLKDELSKIATSIKEETEFDIEHYIYSLPKFIEKISRLPLHLQNITKNYVHQIAPKLQRIRNDRDLIEIISLLIIRASENSDFYNVLKELETTENIDISTLAKVLERWSFAEIAFSTSLIQNRLTVLNHFARIVNDVHSLELQDVHKLLEVSTWLLGEKYALFASNEGLRRILEKMNSKYTGDLGNRRPDLILKRGQEEFVLIELKAPSVEITMTEVGQALKYKKEILDNFPGQKEMDVFLVGRKYDSVVKDQYFHGNPQRVHLLSLNEILQGAQARLNWLSDNIKDEYNYIKSSYALGTESVASINNL